MTNEFPSVGDTRRRGVATYTEMMARALLADGWEVTVLLSVEEGTPLPDPFTTALPVIVHRVTLDTRNRFAGYWPGALEGIQLARTLRRLDAAERFDAIEGHNFEGFNWAIALWFGRRFRLRMHTSLRQHIIAKHQRWTWKRRFAVWLDGFAARRSRNLVTSTGTHAEEMRSEYSLDRRRIDILPLATPDAARRPFHEPPRWVGYLGALEHRKGADLFLESIPGISKVLANVRFVMIGPDPSGAFSIEAEALRTRSTKLRDRLVVTGPISDEALEEWWGQIDLLIVPSRYESFGLAVIEAFSRGIPVLCSNAGALQEVAGNAASLVPPVAEALAARASELLHDPTERRRLAESGFQRFLLRYNDRAFRESLRSLYPVRRRQGPSPSG